MKRQHILHSNRYVHTYSLAGSGESALFKRCFTALFLCFGLDELRYFSRLGADSAGTEVALHSGIDHLGSI